MTLVRQFGFQGNEESNIQAIFDFINKFTDVLSFAVVTGGVEVAIPHNLEAIPSQVFPVIIEGSVVSFANVYAGTTAWTTSKIYLTASLPGTYYVILRR